jgi:hypothetical protein
VHDGAHAGAGGRGAHGGGRGRGGGRGEGYVPGPHDNEPSDPAQYDQRGRRLTRGDIRRARYEGTCWVCGASYYGRDGHKASNCPRANTGR